MKPTLRLVQKMATIAISSLVAFRVFAQDGFADDDAIKQFLHDNFDGKKYGMVVGLIDEHGQRVFGAGSLDNGTRQPVDGDTVFEIGSITKTFTCLLLEDMVERGEMKLDDPVSKYLPASVKMPSRNGKEITLLELATHTSGLPRDVTEITSSNPHNPFDYTAEQLYAFLSNYALTNEPGAKFQYSNLGMGLLGQAIILATKTNYETLVIERICRPLQMNDTRATLSPKLKARFAIGHYASGGRAQNFDFQFGAMAGCGALRSTANDLLKYVSSEIGLTSSSLTPLMEKTQEMRRHNSPGYGNTAMDWTDRGEVYPTNMLLLGHGGGTEGYHTFIGFDKKQRRGAVVLCNQIGGISSETVGWLLLERAFTKQIASGLGSSKNGELVGIGAKLDFDPESHALAITGIVPNSPAAQAGLSKGLIVEKIDGISTTGKSMLVCLNLNLIRGKPGTKVELELRNPKQNETNTVELVRTKLTQSKIR